MNEHFGQHCTFLDYRSVWGKVPVKHCKSSGRAIRRFARADNVIVGNARRIDPVAPFTVDRQCIGAYKSHAVEPFHNGAESAGIIEINKEMLTGGIELHDMRHAVAYLIHAVKLKSKPCFVRDSGQMQHCVRRTSERHIADKRIFYRLVGDNAARTEVTLDELHYPHAGTLRKSNPVGIDGGDSPVSCQGKTEYFRHAVHGVCGEHTGA